MPLRRASHQAHSEAKAEACNDQGAFFCAVQVAHKAGLVAVGSAEQQAAVAATALASSSNHTLHEVHTGCVCLHAYVVCLSLHCTGLTQASMRSDSPLGMHSSCFGMQRLG